MKLSKFLAMFVVALTVFTTGQSYAQDTVASRSTDEQAVRKSIEAFTRAFETGKAETAAKLLTSGAELVADDGAIVRAGKRSRLRSRGALPSTRTSRLKSFPIRSAFLR